MKVCLLSRYFDTTRGEGVGIGEIARQLRLHLSKLLGEENLKTLGSSRTGLFNYFLYSALEIPIKMPRDCDVYHANSPVEALWIPKRKAVVTFQDLFQYTIPHQIGAGMGYNPVARAIGINYFKVACRIASRASRIVCISDEIREEVLKILKIPAEKVDVIEPGVSDYLYPVPKPPSKEIRFGFLGVLDKRKRLDLLIKSFARLYNKTWTLVISGRGPDEGKLRALAARAPVEFLGHVPEEHKRAFYNSLDVFVLPSAAEGFGIPIIEAMACRKPVVLLADAKIPAKLKERCLVVDSFDTFFKDISLIHSVDLKGNCDWARSYTWSGTAIKYLRVYEKVLSQD